MKEEILIEILSELKKINKNLIMIADEILDLKIRTDRIEKESHRSKYN